MSIFPFLSEILENLIEASNSGINSSSMQRVVLFSGHDTVISPVLAGLGVYTGKDCLWPPYASRIVFELWRSSTASANTAASDVEVETEADLVGVFVRVLYNGRSVTHAIPACKVAHELHRGLTPQELCPLEAFSQQVHSLIHPYATLEEACTSKHIRDVPTRP